VLFEQCKFPRIDGPDGKAGLDSGLDFGLDSGLDFGLTFIDLRMNQEPTAIYISFVKVVQEFFFTFALTRPLPRK